MNVAKPLPAPAVTVGMAPWGVIAYGAACASPLFTALVIKALVIPVPYMDEWAWADLLYRLHVGALTFNDLWHQHNEHRIFFPNLIALGLALLGGWSQLREALFSLLLVVITQIGIFVLLRRIIAPHRLPFVFLGASLMLYSLAQIENWYWGFQIGWFMCNACAVWAVLLLGTSGQSWFALIAAVGLAALASFSSSQGLMIWVAGLTTLLLTEKRRAAQIAAWVAFAAAVFGIYFHGYEHPVHHPDALFGLHYPLTTLRYVGAYFGAVFAAWIGFRAAVVCGWVGLLSLVLLLSAVIATYQRDRRPASRANSFVGLALYAVSVAAITTVGRVGFGQEQALASRYTSIAIYCWITILALGYAFERPFFTRVPAKVARFFPLVIFGFAVLYVGADRAGIAQGRGIDAQVRQAYPALIIGRGPELTALFPVEAPVETWIKELQAVKEGPYYK